MKKFWSFLKNMFWFKRTMFIVEDPYRSGNYGDYDYGQDTDYTNEEVLQAFIDHHCQSPNQLSSECVEFTLAKFEKQFENNKKFKL